MAGATALHFDVMRAVQQHQRVTSQSTQRETGEWESSRGLGASLEYLELQIPDHPLPVIQRAVLQLSARRWMDGPWLSCDGELYYLTTDGRDALNKAKASPHLQTRGGWADRMRWPWRECDSQTENVAIPTGGTIRGASISTPDMRAWGMSIRLLTDRDDRPDEDEGWYEIDFSE